MNGATGISELTGAMLLTLFLLIEHVIMISIIFAQRAKMDSFSTVDELVGELVNQHNQSARDPMWLGSVWKQYDGQLFVSLGEAISEGSGEIMVIYRSIFGSADDQKVISRKLFEGNVIIKDKVVPRFVFVPPEKITTELRNVHT